MEKPPGVDRLFADWTTDIGGRDVLGLEPARQFIPPATRVYVGFLGSEDFALRVQAVESVRRSGFVPVPIIAAPPVGLKGNAPGVPDRPAEVAATTSVMVVGGDPAQPLGPYPDAASVIGSGLLEEYGVQEVSIAGYPGRHPAVEADVLWSVLVDKVETLRRQGMACEVVTQFDFDPASVLAWLVAVRERGITYPVHVGVPGPASARRLKSIAAVCGVSGAAAQEYGFALTDSRGTDLKSTVGPERFLRPLLDGCDPHLHGEARLHFMSFNGIAPTGQWVAQWVSEVGDR
jgi:methylenetetrahydrofolate reductase (NADH)